MAATGETHGVISLQTLALAEGWVQIRISDNGKGIDEASLDKVFNPFFTTKSQGTGLGLAITKRLVEQHNGGSITVANNPDGKGAMFTITFPAEPENHPSLPDNAG